MATSAPTTTHHNYGAIIPAAAIGGMAAFAIGVIFCHPLFEHVRVWLSIAIIVFVVMATVVFYFTFDPATFISVTANNLLGV